MDENNSLEAVDRLVEHFSAPLVSAGANVDEIHAEFEGVIQYATDYISLSTLDYRAVWWRLLNAPSASDWINVLTLAELLFSLPASNEKLERIFSQLNIIESNKKTSLTNDTLDDLLMVSTMGSPLEEFNPDKAIDLWWGDKIRRPMQKKRKLYEKQGASGAQPRSSTTSDSESESGSIQLLDEWDNWVDSDSDN